MFLRIAYRAAAWEGEDSAEDVVIAELSLKNGLPDLSPSVYQVDSTDSVVRVCVEHRANGGLRAPDKRSAAVDLDGLGHVPSLDPQINAPFSFCASRHHTITLRDQAALVQMVRGVLAESAARNHPAPLREMKQHVRGQVAANDGEWIAFLITPLGMKWRSDLNL